MTKKPAAKRAAPPARRDAAKKPKAVVAQPAEQTPSKRQVAGSIPAPRSKKRQRLDWEAIERDYRTGKFTLRELAAKYNTDDATIGRQITKERKADPSRWQKDLTSVVRQATNAKLMQALVSKQISEGQQNVSTAVNAAAELNARVILGQQERAASVIDVTMRMLAELDATTLKAGELEAMFLKISGADEEEDPALKRALMSRFNDFMRLHNRIGSVHKLMDALTKAQAQEAKAFGLERDGGQGEGDAFEDRVADMEGELPP